MTQEKLEEAKRLYQTANADQKYVLETLFPELKESEDERVRKFLIGYFGELVDENSEWGLTKETRDKILAWLEAQGEPTEINPTEFDTRLQNLIGQFDSLPKEELIGSLSFWINVVQNDGTYKKEKQGEQKPQHMISAEAKEAMYDKPVWSKEDEDRLDIIFERIERGLIVDKDDIDRLKSLRPQNRWKPSDEQMEALLKLEEMHVLEHEKNQENAHLYMVVKSIREQLLKLREG